MVYRTFWSFERLLIFGQSCFVLPNKLWVRPKNGTDFQWKMQAPKKKKKCRYIWICATFVSSHSKGILSTSSRMHTAHLGGCHWLCLGGGGACPSSHPSHTPSDPHFITTPSPHPLSLHLLSPRPDSTFISRNWQYKDVYRKVMVVNTTPPFLKLITI